MFARLYSQVGVESAGGPDATVGEAFDSAFRVLKRVGLRDEYVYRAALTHKVLMGKHSLNTASMLSEFRVGRCKADLAILNGTATVYEIKSERDSLSRLSNQIGSYKKVFANVYVVTSEDHLRGVVATTPHDVGILCLSRRYQISTVREAVDRSDRISPAAVFESLRTVEARSVLAKLGIDAPNVPNTRERTVMANQFAALVPQEVHTAMVKTLKETRSLATLSELIGMLPYSLHAAALSIQPPRYSHGRLLEAINSPLGTATAWA